MMKFAFKISSLDKDLLLNLTTALAPEETLRIRFYGTLSNIKSLCQVSLFVAKGLKVARSWSYLTDYDGEELLLDSMINKLPDYERQLNESGHLIVDFEAPVLGVKENKVQVLLPESYKATANPRTPEHKAPRTFTFRTEHIYLFELISMILENKPVVKFYGPLSKLHPSQSKVEITFPVRLDTDTLAGGRVSLTTQGITMAVIDDIPGWEEMADSLGTPGYLFVNFEAVILRVSGEEMTVALPVSYR